MKVFCVMFENMYRRCGVYFEGAFFVKSFENLVFEDFNFKIRYFNVKMIYSKSQKGKNFQNHVPTNRGVIWAILKLIKIRDQGMELVIFVLCF